MPWSSAWINIDVDCWNFTIDFPRPKTESASGCEARIGSFSGFRCHFLKKARRRTFYTSMSKSKRKKNTLRPRTTLFRFKKKKFQIYFKQKLRSLQKPEILNKPRDIHHKIGLFGTISCWQQQNQTKSKQKSPKNCKASILHSSQKDVKMLLLCWVVCRQETGFLFMLNQTLYFKKKLWRSLEVAKMLDHFKRISKAFRDEKYLTLTTHTSIGEMVETKQQGTGGLNGPCYYIAALTASPLL